MADVIFVENDSFKRPLSEDEMLAMLRQRNCIGMIAEYGGRIVGFMIYELQRSKLVILDFAVEPTWRNRSVGSQMIAKLKGKLSMEKRHTLSVINRESNLAGSLFLKRQGFTAELIRGHFEKEDGLLFSHRVSLVADVVKNLQESFA